MSAPDRFECTAATPWTGEARATHKRARHPDARDAGECAEGCCDYYVCPHCGHRFAVTVPD